MSAPGEVFPLWQHAEVRVVVPVADYYDGPQVAEQEVRLSLQNLIEHIAECLEVTAFGREDSADIRASPSGYYFSLPDRIKVASESHQEQRADEQGA